METENIGQSSQMMKMYYETQMEKIQEEHRIEVDRLESKIVSLDKELRSKDIDKKASEMEAQEYKEKCFKLEKDIMSANSKFN